MITSMLLWTVLVGLGFVFVVCLSATTYPVRRSVEDDGRRKLSAHPNTGETEPYLATRYMRNRIRAKTEALW
jgi:hypothetical protein